MAAAAALVASRGGARRIISAASARSHTRTRSNSTFSTLPLFSGISWKLLIVSVIGFLAWAYQAACPPMPKICGSPGGPPVTAPRIKLSNGRHLAYKEFGIPKDTATYKIIFIHGISSCRHDAYIATTLSPDVVESLGVYIVSFDRPGYGESDPDPHRTVKSLALDIEEFADQLGLGSRFYLIGNSMGGQVVWSCLKHIPHRLAGAALIAPVVNFWWPNLPSNLSKEVLSQQFQQDQWAMRVAHYVPWLTYWWNTQSWFPASSVILRSKAVLSHKDLELAAKRKRDKNLAYATQQGEYESRVRDLMIGFGTWEFDPIDIENPFPNKEGSVHVWQGDEDKLVPATLQRYIAQKLPWVQYHELSGFGHTIPPADGVSDAIVKSLLIGDK